MRERINRLAKGIIDIEIPCPVIQPSHVEETVRSGVVTKGELFITSENNLHIKGLAYSSDPRVRVVNSAFGGLRIHVNYEVNSYYLENGDCIKGSFYLVTNGGEKEIPYSFHVEAGASGRLLRELEKPEDFAELAKKDMDTALRLFDYQDFAESPFMKDIRIRTMYDGLKGHGSRHNMLEEFLVALKVKDPVRVEIQDDEREYENPLEPIQDKILVDKNTWGHIYIEAAADGDFIDLPKKTITDQDFIGDRCEFVYQIDPDRLHRGINLGCIRFTTFRQSWTVKIKAMGDETVDISDGDMSGYKEGYNRYLSLRLDLESGNYEEEVIRGQMMKELDRLQLLSGKKDLLTLLQAELYIMSGRKDTACLLLDECRDHILSARQEQVPIYCFYQYLNLLTQDHSGQKASLIRLVNKYLAEGADNRYLFLLLLKLDPDGYENPGTLLSGMKRWFKDGCHSPFLYMEALKLIKAEPGMLRSMEGFELQVLYFGAKRGMIDEEMALTVAKLANGLKHFNRLCYRLLKLLYELYPRKELLSAICCLLIKGECRGSQYFSWYEKGLEEGISLTRLYEYYLYSLPKDFDHLLPKEALLYFSYDNQLDRHSKSVLYMNILKYLETDDPLYKEYEREIEKFAMEQLFQARINSRLAVIYDHMVYRDVIDERVAEVLPAVLKSYRVQCGQKNMQYVIVCYEELVKEDAFLLEDGAAYVPLFSENSLLMFQDAFGNRYINVDYEKIPVMEKPDLEERCYEVYPRHPMLRLKECSRIMEEGPQDEDEVLTLEKTMEELKLHPMYQHELLSGVIGYYQRQMDQEGVDELPDTGSGYLLHLDKKGLTTAERVEVCETLICQGCYKEAYEMIRDYLCYPRNPSRLQRLCARMILKKLFDQEELLLKLSYQVFAGGKNESVILDYLCEYYNGTADQMYKILRRAVAEHVETYDMEERLVAQMIFSGATGKLDQAFDLYVTRKKSNESIIKAYFTIKSSDYFLQEKPAKDHVFTYLENAMRNAAEKDKVPTIYLLALCRYYSTLKTLDEEQKTLCRAMMDILLEEGMVFAWFQDIGKHVSLPEDILDKAVVEYHGQKDSKPELLIRILPDEEEYHAEDMNRVFQGIFVRQKVLFEGEIMEYQIYDSVSGKRSLIREGSLTCEPVQSAGSSRFARLNEMGLCLSLKEDERLHEKMKDYLLKTAEAEELFQLM